MPTASPDGPFSGSILLFSKKGRQSETRKKLRRREELDQQPKLPHVTEKSPKEVEF